MKALFGKTVDMLSALMDYHAERHKIISSNVANIDTPGYEAKELKFRDEYLRLVMKERDGGADPSAMKPADRYETLTTAEKVDIDREMSRLAENQLQYNLSAEFLARKFRGIKNMLTQVK